MDLHLDADLWSELVSSSALRVPEEGDPRKKAKALWAGRNGRSSLLGSSQPNACNQAAASCSGSGSSIAQQGTDQQQQQQTPPAEPAAAPQAIARRHASELSYSDFVRDYMSPNIPVIIEGAADGWRARQEWVRPDGSLDLDFLEANFGNARVTATDTAREHEGCGLQRSMTLAEFIAWWRQHSSEAAGAGAAAENRGPGDSTGRELLYVKDWHFAKDFPQYKAYECPLYFQDDWLNEWYDVRRARIEAAAGAAAEVGSAAGSAAGAAAAADEGTATAAAVELAAADRLGAAGGQVEAGRVAEVEEQELVGVALGTAAAAAAAGAAGGCHGGGGDDVASDYRFVYVGPKDTWTPLHSDVLRSHSWSTNVAGRKRWRMLHPRYSHLLYDRHASQMAPDFWLTGDGGEACTGEQEAEQFPGLAEARTHMIEFIQEPGESVFVPSGWHHSVENVEDTISINHNWINGHNVHWTWQLVVREYAEAEEGIEDCRHITSPAEFEGLVQRNLSMNCGLDFASLGEFMRCIAQHSMQHLAACQAQHEAQLAACHTQQAGQQAGQAAGQQGGAACCCCSGESMRPTEEEAGSTAGGTAAGAVADVASKEEASAAAACACEAQLPACCRHHAFRLQRAGLVLSELLAAQQGIAQRCQHQGSGLEQAADTGQGQQQQQHCEEQQQDGVPQQWETQANQECLRGIRQALCGAGLAHLAVGEAVMG